MTKLVLVKTESTKKEVDRPCHHPFLKTDKRTFDKICTSCGRVIYSAAKR